MKRWFLRLTEREQLSLAACALALAVYALVALVWLPVRDRLDTALHREAQLQMQLQEVQSMATEIASLRERAGSRGESRNLGSLLSRSAQSYRLPVSRLQPLGDDVQIRFERVSVEALLRWLQELEQRQRLRLKNVSLLAMPGNLVNANIRVANAY